MLAYLLCEFAGDVCREEGILLDDGRSAVTDLSVLILRGRTEFFVL